MTNKWKHYPKLKRREMYQTKSSGGYYEYSRYKDEIVADSLARCVYCDVHADELGGEEMMQLDHFKPQRLFPNLKNNPNNLVLACPRCNLLKRDDWINDDNIEGDVTFIGDVGYVDPFKVDRSEYFTVIPTGELLANKSPAHYMIERLALDRRFLKLNRVKRNLLSLMISLYEKEKNLLELKVKQATDKKEIEDYKLILGKVSVKLKVLQTFWNL